jgi:Flp pilus assembly protein TadD
MPSDSKHTKGKGVKKANRFVSAISAIRANWMLLIPPLIILLLYLPAVKFSLVWDDTIYLRDMPNYRDPSLWLPSLFHAFVLSPNYFRPLALLTFVGEINLGGAAGLFHLTNILLHSLNTLLVVILVRRLIQMKTMSSKLDLQSIGPPIAAGLIYGLHPALIEGVAFVSGRFDLLMTSFLLVALLADLNLRGRPSRSTAVGLAFLGAALSKEMAVAFALALPFWHLATGDSSVAPRRRLINRETLEVYVAVIVTGLTYLGIRFVSLGYLFVPNSPNAVPGGTILQHVLLSAKSLGSYILLAIWPFNTLSPIHYSGLPVLTSDPTAWLAVVVDILVILGVLRWARRDSVSGWLALGSLVTLLPVINIFPLELGGGAFIAERYLVFPLALLALALGAALQMPFGQLAASLESESRALWSLPWVWLALAAITLQLTLPNWRSDLSLWQWAAARAPQSATPYANLALQYASSGQDDTALQLAQQAVNLDPSNADAWDDAGLAFFHKGDYKNAEAAFSKATELQPQNALFWSNLAGAQREQGNLEQAEDTLVSHALKLNPNLPSGQLNLGIVYLKANRPDLAQQHLNAAMRLLPPSQESQVQGLLDQTRDPNLWLSLGEQLLQNGETDNAQNALLEARQLGASSADVAVALSGAYIQMKDWQNANDVLDQAVQQSPDDARLYNNLGIVAREQGDTAKARQYFSQAVELDPSSAQAKQNLDALPTPSP